MSTRCRKPCGGRHQVFIVRSRFETLLNEASSKEGLLKGLERLKREVTSRDVALVYLAARAVPGEEDEVYFLTPDTALDLASLKRDALPASELEEQLSFIAGKVLLFIDACAPQSFAAAGGKSADLSSLIARLASPKSGVIVYTSCTESDVAHDDITRPNGPFAEALASSLDGSLAYGGDGKLTLTELDRALAVEVAKLTDGRQHTAFLKPDTVPLFAFASRPLPEGPRIVEPAPADSPPPLDVEVLSSTDQTPQETRSATAISAEESWRVRLRIRNARLFKRFAIDGKEITPDEAGIVEIERTPDAQSDPLTLMGDQC